MVTDARGRFASLLGDVAQAGAWSARRTSRPDDLRIEVRGVGPIGLPVSAQQAQQLCGLARPAPFGRGEKTLVDPTVRDTFQIPTTRVKIDKRQWDRTLGPVLAGLATDLGLPRECSLAAEFHSMLVYGPGQFFAPHQDSEKADEMIGTLVVMLPSDAKGGVLQLDHGGTTVSYRSSQSSLTFVAFYADCRHQVKPVTSGYRVVLTYNLLLRGSTATSGGARVDPELVTALAKALNEHFETRIPGRYGAADPDPPMRLVYLLDHEYTERGLAWDRLKGLDASRAEAVRAAAEAADCDVVLALADVHENWNAEEAWEPPPRHRRWSWDDDDHYSGRSGGSSPDDYELTELLDSSIKLTWWLDQPGGQPTPTSLHVSDDEVCESTPSAELTPYAAEYEGYMGNYGNTMDRWYRRAALVLWPRRLAFAVRAEGSPQWALDTLTGQIKAGDLDGARSSAETLAGFWKAALSADQPRGLVVKALRVARDLDESRLATMLLEPLQVEMFTKSHASPLARLAAAYGQAWSAEIVGVWFGAGQPHWSTWRPDRAKWVETLPSLCAPLAAHAAGGAAMSKLLVAAAWTALRDSVARSLKTKAPSHRELTLTQAGPAIAAVLAATATNGDAELRDRVVAFLRQDNEHLTAALMPALKAGAKLSAGVRQESGHDALAAHCAAQLAARLAHPERTTDDWSIDWPADCGCELCATLAQFLHDPVRRSFEWPLAEPKRRHVHSQIDAMELPVLHETRRKGSPYTLVLTKTTALFDRERDQRHRDQADLTWLKRTYALRSR